jgi:hypothetical protein
VVVILALAKTRNYIAGLVPLFPTFALIAHYIVGKGRSVDDLKTTILFGMWSIIPYFVYLAARDGRPDAPGGVAGGGRGGLADGGDRAGQRVGTPAHLTSPLWVWPIPCIYPQKPSRPAFRLDEPAGRPPKGKS